MPNIDEERPMAMLTKKDRKYLNAEGAGFNRHQKSERKRSIVRRTRHSLIDFSILTNKIPSDWREEIFADSPVDHPYYSKQNNVAKMIEFLYVGLGGETGFRKPLERGVEAGEVSLGNADFPFQINTIFRIDQFAQDNNPQDIVHQIENGQWNKLHPPDIAVFIQWAQAAGAIDFEKIQNEIEKSELAAKMREDHVEFDVLTQIIEENKSDLGGQ